jgi:RNA polymerase sigma-70 factor (ECF subfamily)
LRVYRHIDGYEERGSFQAWVFRIATNLALTELRRRRYRTAEPLDAAALEIPDRSSPDPADLWETGDRALTMQAALAHLADDQRAVILLRARQGMRIQDIARTLCVPEGTVKSRIHHAVRRLREFVNHREQIQEAEERNENLR